MSFFIGTVCHPGLQTALHWDQGASLPSKTTWNLSAVRQGPERTERQEVFVAGNRAEVGMRYIFEQTWPTAPDLTVSSLSVRRHRKRLAYCGSSSCTGEGSVRKTVLVKMGME